MGFFDFLERHGIDTFEKTIVVVLVLVFSVAIPIVTLFAITPSISQGEVVQLTPFDNHQLVHVYSSDSTRSDQYFSVPLSCNLYVGENVTLSLTIGAWWYWPLVPLHIVGC